jgi:hypothetical protein
MKISSKMDWTNKECDAGSLTFDAFIASLRGSREIFDLRFSIVDCRLFFNINAPQAPPPNLFPCSLISFSVSQSAHAKSVTANKPAASCAAICIIDLFILNFNTSTPQNFNTS